MRNLALILCVIGAAVGMDPNLKVRFEVTLLGIGTSAFIEMPKTVSEATAARWTAVTKPDLPSGLDALELWCPTTDYTTCVFYDDTEFVAGTQVAFEESRFSDSVYDWAKQGFTYWSTTVDGNATTFWTIQQYFIDETALAIDADTRIAARDSTKLLQHGAVWVAAFDGELYEISDNVTALVDNNFTEQACIVWMGTHYYYNMSSDTECDSDTFPFPWFPLVSDDELVGIGLMVFGTYDYDTDKTNWFEDPSQSDVEMIVPYAPDCMYTLAGSPGVVTMHTYYVNHPYFIFC